MFPSVRCPRRYAGIFGSVTAAVAAFSMVGFMPAASAQTAPQLLPYTSRLVAGGGSTAVTVGSTCQRPGYPTATPVISSGKVSTDKYGDGCLATEISLTGPRFAVADSTGAVFFSDYTNGLIRRVDPTTGVVTAVAGGGTTVAGTVATPVACGTKFSIDALGDGCLATGVALTNPTGLAFDANGNLFFADHGTDTVREIVAVAGQITSASVIQLIVGSPAKTYGYNVSNTSPTPPVIAATSSYLNYPFGIAFDKNGNLYIQDEGNNAIEVVNLTANSETLFGLTVAPGSISKIAGYGNLASTNPSATASATSGDCPDFQSTTFRGGCDYGAYTNGVSALSSNVDGNYSIAVDSTGNVYFTDEYENTIVKINAGTTNLSTQAGAYPLSGNAGVRTNADRSVSTTATFGVGSPFGIATDSTNNVYFTDAFNGLVWRIDATTSNMYAVGGGAATVCASAIDSYGDGCPALQATFGKSGTSYAASASPGVFGISADANSNVFVGDTLTNTVREIASGTQFGITSATQTDIIAIHFASGDAAAATTPYAITSGSTIFSIGTVSCKPKNSDNTTDCFVPVTASPSASGAYTGALTVYSTSVPAGTTFPLSGYFAQSPVTRTTVSYTTTSGSSCNSTSYSTSASFTFTAKLVANGPSAPTGTIQFYDGATAIGSAQTVANIGTSAAPVYGASYTTTLPTAGSHSITATYTPTPTSGSFTEYYTGSTSVPAVLTISTGSYTVTPSVTSPTYTVVAGGTALYSFTLATSVYAGTINFACSGLPAGASCVFNPPSLVSDGCSTSSTVAVSIFTTAPLKSSPAGFGGTRGPWSMIGLFAGLLLATCVGIFRRRIPMRAGQMLMAVALLLGASGMVACSKPAGTVLAPGTPAGTYAVAVNATGSEGTVHTFNVTLIVK